MLKKLWQWIEKNENIVWLLVLVILLRIPSLYEPYWYGDEGIYLVLGQGLRKGLVFYRDIHDNKPPLLYVLAAIAHNVFYFRLMLMVWFGTATVMFFRLMQLMFPKNSLSWLISTLAMIVLTTVTEGNIANAEIFIVLPVVLGMFISYQEVKRKAKDRKMTRWLGVGLLFSIGFLLKVPALFDLAAVAIWLVFFEAKSLKDKRLWLLMLGFLTPVILSVVYYAKMGAGERYFRSALGQNIGYLTSWQTGEHSASGFASQSGLITRAGLLTVSLGFFFWLNKKIKLSSGAILTIIWFLTALFGVLLSERPYPHYLIQLVVPAAILFSFFLFGKRKILKVIILTMTVITGYYYNQVGFWQYPIASYYKNFIVYSLGGKTQEEYRNYFDPRVNQTYKLAEYLREKTNNDDRVFIWGDEPGVYALANRLPIGRYTVAYHIMDFNGFEETLKAWGEYKPKVVIVMEYEEREFPEMEGLLAADYVMVEKIERAMIFRRVNGVKKEPASL